LEQSLSVEGIPALLLEDIRKFGCFSCGGENFGTKTLPRGSGLWRCVACGFWQVVVKEGEYGSHSPISVGYFAETGPKEESCPVIIVHPKTMREVAFG